MALKTKNILATSVGALALDNPILTASGTYGSGKEYADFVDLKTLGAVVTKSVTFGPMRGNPPPRVVETPSGMLNAIGLQNEGVGVFLKDLLPPLKKQAKRIVVNVAGKATEDYVKTVKALSKAKGIDALEINISCPNVKEGGIAFGVCPDTAGTLVAKLRRATKLPLWVKLSPNVADITAIARAVEKAGADALVVANTLLGMAVDIEKQRPILANVTGGLSGPAVHPIALRLVWQVANATRLPIVAVGGVKSIREVIAFLQAGASAVEVGTMNFVEPDLCGRLVKDLHDWCAARKTTVRDQIGALALPEQPAVRTLRAFEPRIHKKGKNQLLYRFRTPHGWDRKKTQKYPLVLFLHGAGERGNNNTSQLKLGVHEFEDNGRGEQYPCFIAAPQCPTDDQWVRVPWYEDAHTMPKAPSTPLRLALDLVETLMKKYPIDPKRIYITGVSMGGFGTWDCLQRRPDLFAAGAPVCGGGDTAQAKTIKHIPIRTFHGERDTVVKTKRSRDMVAALKAVGAKVGYTEYPEIGHNAWTPTYVDDSLYAWMFRQRKK